MRPIKYTNKIVLLLLFFLAVTFTGFSQIKEKDSDISNEGLITLNAERVKIKGSISLFGHRRTIVVIEETKFETLKRVGADLKLYKEIFKDYDLGKRTLIGINLITQYNKEPAGLSFNSVIDKVNKTYIIYLNYDVQADPTKRFISHPIWFAVPKLPEDYNVTFKIETHSPISEFTGENIF